MNRTVANMQPAPDLQRMRDVLSYDSATGNFVWRASGKGRRMGRPAGSVRSDGYVRISIDGVSHYAHRLAWFYVTGEWPPETIDHENTDPTDNRFDNLRKATHGQNRANRGRQKNSSTGVKGVYRDFWSDAYIVVIGKNRKYERVGKFSTINEARMAYAKRSAELFGEFARAD